MPRRVRIPPALTRAPFSVSDAREAGVGERRLKSADLRRPFYGVRTLAPIRADDELTRVIDRCREYAPRLLPGQFFSHLTAARLWGIPLPTRFSDAELIHVTSTAPMNAPRGRGVSGHVANDAATAERHGLPVSSAEQTWIELASLLSLDDLTAAGDALVLDPVVFDPYDSRPFTTVAALGAALDGFHGRGAKRAASAHSLIRTGVESRTETLLRLLAIRAGFPEPEIGIDIRDSDGKFLGRADMFFREWRTIYEYDGDQHRSSTAQYERDIARIDAFIAADYSVVRVRSWGLFVNPAHTVARLHRALRGRGWPG